MSSPIVIDTHFPSGENLPNDSPLPDVTCRSGDFPSNGTTHKWLTLVFFSSDTSVTENITHFPLGEICGSLTRFIAIKSANVIGRFVPA
jgi:hypothetical protein